MGQQFQDPVPASRGGVRVASKKVRGEDRERRRFELRTFEGQSAAPLHTQNCGEPSLERVSQKRQRPTEEGWALNGGGGQLTMCRLASRAYEHRRGLLRVKRPTGAERVRIAFHGVYQQSGK